MSIVLCPECGREWSKGTKLPPLYSCTCELFIDVTRLKEALKKCGEFQKNALKTFRKHKFVFDGKNGRWEKLAFTLYTDLCEIESLSRQTLEE